MLTHGRCRARRTGTRPLVPWPPHSSHASSSALPRRSCRFHEQLGKKSWTCGQAPATMPRCGPSPAGRGTRAAGAPGPNLLWLMPWLMWVRDKAGLEAAARGATRLTAGHGECWKMGWGAPGRGRQGSEVVGLGRATAAAFLFRCRLAHPQCYGGAAALLSSAPGAAVHLPLPLQVKSCAGNRREGRGPAPSLGTLYGASGHPKSESIFDAPSPHPAT